MKMEYYLIIALMVSICVQVVHFLKYLPSLRFPKMNATLIAIVKNRSKQQIQVEFELDAIKYSELCDITGLDLDLTGKHVDIWFSPNNKGLCFACKPTLKLILKKLGLFDYRISSLIKLKGNQAFVFEHRHE